MMTTNRRTKLIISLAILALGLTALSHRSAFAQADPASDSAKQAESFKAMEAAADSARKVAQARAARAKVDEKANDPKQEVTDSAAAAAAAKAAEETATNAARADTSDKSATNAIPADTVAQTTEAKPDVPVDPTAPYKSVKFAPDEKPRVVIETTMGKVVLELWPDVAPKHCQNLVYQVNQGFYDSLTVHRVVPGFVIQGGDPEGTGTGGPGYTVPAEFSTKHLHEEGTLAMARRVDPLAKTGAPEKPEYLNSAGSQFFICLARFASLDGKYTVFGKVVEGLDVVHSIEKIPTQRERPVTPVYMTKVYIQPKA